MDVRRIEAVIKIGSRYWCLGAEVGGIYWNAEMMILICLGKMYSMPSPELSIFHVIFDILPYCLLGKIAYCSDRMHPPK